MKLFLLFFIMNVNFGKVLVNPNNQKVENRKLLNIKKLSNIYKKHTLFSSNNKYLQKTKINLLFKKNQNLKITLPHNYKQRRRYLETQIKSQEAQINQNIQNEKKNEISENLENKENLENTENMENFQNPQNEEENVQNENKIQNMNYPNKSLQEILHYSISQSEKKTPVIIINQPNKNETQKTDYINPIYISPKKNTLDNLNEISISDIDTLILILNNIENLYTSFYEKLPENLNESEKSNSDKNLNTYVQRLQLFTRDIMMNSDSLMSDINYLENKLHKLQPGIENMMFFYNLEEKYSKLKLQLTVTDNKQIQAEFEELSKFSQNYDVLEKSIKKYAFDLYKFNDFFAAQIKSINQSGFSENSNKGVEAFDRVLMLSVRLIELKVDLEKCLENLRSDFEELQRLGEDIEGVVLNLGEKVEKEVILVEKEKEAKDNGKVFVKEFERALGVLTLGVLMFV